MLSEEWITSLIAEVKESNPNVTETVVEHIKELLKSNFTYEQFTSSELKEISKSLLQEMDEAR